LGKSQHKEEGEAAGGGGGGASWRGCREMASADARSSLALCVWRAVREDVPGTKPGTGSAQGPTVVSTVAW